MNISSTEHRRGCLAENPRYTIQWKQIGKGTQTIKKKHYKSAICFPKKGFEKESAYIFGQTVPLTL